MARPGTNYNTRMAAASRAEADGRLVLPSFQPPQGDPADLCPACAHPWADHETDIGCLHGWTDVIVGCGCSRPRYT